MNIFLRGLWYFQEGGPIGLVRNGDVINVDVREKRLDVQLTDTELEERRKKFTPPPYKATRGVLYKVMESASSMIFFPPALKVFTQYSLSFQYIKNVQSSSKGCVTDE